MLVSANDMWEKNEQKTDQAVDAEFLGEAKGGLSHTVIEIFADFW